MRRPSRVRVFVASDVTVYRESISRLVATEEALELAGAAGTAETPSRLRDHTRTDVVLLDATRRADPTLACEIASAARDAHLVALVAPEQEDQLLAWADAGVSGFLSWESSSRQVVEILRRAARGESPCSPDVADAFFRRARENPGSAVDGGLTRRQEQIAELLAEGLSNKAIASTLSIELATVKNHVHSVLDKLGVDSRGQAAAKLRQPGVGRRV
jgi:two-component system, NarL family, nitrate/nitrite response regulator NarL